MSKLQKKIAMRFFIRKKGIGCLWHFTKLENLDGILNIGIQPRATLEKNGSIFVFNDDRRINGQKEASCLSIQFPNYKMFYGLRCDDPKAKWVVFKLSPDILWKKDCAFCVENAASNNVTSIELIERKGLDAFKKLFADETLRKKTGIVESYPTNPQAEVLVFEEIDTSFIIEVYTQSAKTRNKLDLKYPKINFIHSDQPFRARSDYKYW